MNKGKINKNEFATKINFTKFCWKTQFSFIFKLKIFCFKLIFIYFFFNHHKIYNFLTSKTLLCVGFFSGKVKMWKIVNLNILKPPNYQNLINTCLLDLIKQDNTRFCWKNIFIFLIFHWKKIKKCSKIFIKFWCILIPKIIIS